MMSTMARDTGFPGRDAQDDFLRARRRRGFAQLSALLRLQVGDVELMLPFDEVVAALGRVGENDRGVVTIALHSIVGTVDRGKEFDREFRPTSSRARTRFERIAEASRRGVAMAPIDVYRVGELHFVRDGHHRVEVARAQGRDIIDARVVEVVTRVAAGGPMALADLPLKGHEPSFTSASRCPRRSRRRSRSPTRSSTARSPRASRRGAFACCSARAPTSIAGRPPCAGWRRSTCRSSRCSPRRS